MHEGIVAQRAGHLDRAAAHYRLALTKRPGLRGAENNLGVIALERGNLPGALAHFEAALGRGKEVPFARLNHAITRLRLGDREGALKEARPLAKMAGGSPPKTPQGRAVRATARVLLAAASVGDPAGDHKEAAAMRAALDGIMARSSGEPEALSPALRGAALRLAGHLAVQARAWAPAAESLEEAERLRAQAQPKGQPQDLALRAALALRTGAPARAISLTGGPLGGALPSPPLPSSTAWAAVVRAHALAQTGKGDDAKALLDRVLSPTPACSARAQAGAQPGPAGGTADPCPPPSPPQLAALRLRAALRSARGEWAAALADLDAVWRATPAAPGLLVDQATALAHLGRVEQARAAAAGALQRAPGDPRARALVAALR